MSMTVYLTETEWVPVQDWREARNAVVKFLESNRVRQSAFTGGHVYSGDDEIGYITYEGGAHTWHGDVVHWQTGQVLPTPKRGRLVVSAKANSETDWVMTARGGKDRKYTQSFGSLKELAEMARLMGITHIRVEAPYLKPEDLPIEHFD